MATNLSKKKDTKKKYPDDDLMFIKVNKPCLFERHNIIGQVCYFWLWTFFVKNYGKNLTADDMPKPPVSDRSHQLADRLEEEWKKEIMEAKMEQRKVSLYKVLNTIHGPLLFFISVFCIISHLIQVVQAYSLSLLIEDCRHLVYPDSIEEDGLTTNNSTQSLAGTINNDVQNRIYLYCGALVLLQFIYVQTINVHNFISWQVGIRIRTSLSSLIYRKGLCLSSGAFRHTTPGQVATMLSNDLMKIELMILFLPYPILCILLTALITGFLYMSIRVYCCIAPIIVLVFLLFQVQMGRWFKKFRLDSVRLTDERLRLMSDFLPAMRIIKMYAWEHQFAKLVAFARKREVLKIQAGGYLTCINHGLFYVMGKSIVFAFLIVWLISGGSLSASFVFVTATLVGKLALIIGLYLPLFVQNAAHCLVSIRRVYRFLLLPEQKIDVQTSSNNTVTQITNEPRLTLSNVTASYGIAEEQNSEGFTLQMNSSMYDRQLTVIVGSVGSGKSSALLSVMNELSIFSGRVHLKGQVSYAAQDPWLFSGSVKENILFGTPMNNERYQKVIEVCALRRDLKLMPQNDLTLVGERGVSLSGGQRARLSLARALYREADVYLLDDPLSAVDGHVAKHLYQYALRDFLRNKCVILVTHQLQVITEAEQLILLRNGRIVLQGEFKQCLDKVLKEQEFSDLSTGMQSNSDHPSSTHAVKKAENKEFEQQADEFVEPVRLSENCELSATWNAYKVYLNLGLKWWQAVILIGSFFVTQSIYSGSDYWLSLWTDSQERWDLYIHTGNESYLHRNIVDEFNRQTNMSFYSLQMGILFSLSLIRAILFFRMCMRASISLHNRLFEKVIRAPISFFDQNPVGVLLNRVSKDMGIVDENMPNRFYVATDVLCIDASIVIMICLINYWLLAPFAIFVILVMAFRKLYLRTARMITILECTMKSPIFQHLSSSLVGLQTIRAFQAQDRFRHKFDVLQNDHLGAYFTFFCSLRWFVYVTETFQVFFIGGISLGIAIMAEYFTGSSVGLIIYSTILFCSQFQWMIKNWNEVETQMISVDRLNYYATLDSEAPLESPAALKPPEEWPETGQLQFEHVWLQYGADCKPVLRDVTFTIEPGQKVGIVGRTGAGKSSMLAALFRMTELHQGRIIVDGRDTSQLGLHDLRKKLSIIPQEPVLFTGTVRSNLDPFDEQTDDRLWNSLKEVNLHTIVKQMPGGLSAPISDRAAAFSLGQKQLLCLARAMLRNNRILVMDEATANCDPLTDELIQKTVRTIFKNCTIITIAHRLQTIIEADRVLVMDAGRLMEFDRPLALLLNPDSLFSNLVRSAGGSAEKRLKKMALDSPAGLKEEILLSKISTGNEQLSSVEIELQKRNELLERLGLEKTEKQTKL